MKNCCYLLFILMLAAYFSGCAKKYAWFVPSAGRIVVLEIEMDAHTKKEVDIKSDVPLSLYVETNASQALVEKYNFSDHFPVRLEHANGIDSIATVKGAGGGVFPSVGGVIPLILKNETDEALQIVICKESEPAGQP